MTITVFATSGYLHPLQLPKLSLHPNPVHLQLPLAVHNKPPVDAQLLDGKERMRAFLRHGCVRKEGVNRTRARQRRLR